jgi:hypothetical protein
MVVCGKGVNALAEGKCRKPHRDEVAPDQEKVKLKRQRFRSRERWGSRVQNVSRFSRSGTRLPHLSFPFLRAFKLSTSNDV